MCMMISETGNAFVDSQNAFDIITNVNETIMYMYRSIGDTFDMYQSPDYSIPNMRNYQSSIKLHHKYKKRKEPAIRKFCSPEFKEIGLVRILIQVCLHIRNKKNNNFNGALFCLFIKLLSWARTQPH